MLEFLTRNWSLKLLAVVLGFGLWVFVVGQEKAEVSVRVPVEFTKIPKDMVVGDVIESVDVRLYGPRSLINKATSGSLAKVISLHGLGPGVHEFQVSSEDLDLPRGVRVNRVNPDRFAVTLAKKLTRKVPVRPILSGKPAPGLEVAEVVFDPPRVTISGTKEDVKDLDWIWTAPIPVKDIKKDQSLQIRLRVPAGRAVRLDPASVKATIKLKDGEPELSSAPAPKKDAPKKN